MMESSIARIPEITFLSDDVVRVQHRPDNHRVTGHRSLVVPEYSPGEVNVSEYTSGNEMVYRTGALEVRVNQDTGCVAFIRADSGRTLLQEAAPAVASPCMHDKTALTVVQDFVTPDGEGLYGLGQVQNRIMNWRGHSASLVQANLTIAAPFLLSTRGYGLFWDNTSQTAFGDFEELIPADNLFHSDSKQPGLVADYFSDDNFGKYERTEVVPKLDILWEKGVPDGWHEADGAQEGARRSVRMKGKLKTRLPGNYHFRLQAPHGARLVIDGKVVIEHWGETCIFDHKGFCELPGDSFVEIVIECQMLRSWIGSFLQLSWQAPVREGTYRFSSEAADAVDYTFIYGPEAAQVHQQFTALTGRSPMFPRWVFGLWQSKERYTSEAELESVVKAYRKEAIPLDLIVQDWRYWDPAPWGSHEVNAERYPDFAAFTQRMREEEHVQIGLSVWTNFQPGSDNFEELKAHNAFLPYGEDGKGFRFIDVFSEQTNELYWRQVHEQLAPNGIDIWWLDATEPETVHPANANTLRSTLEGNALGSGSRYLNAYALQNAEGFAKYMAPLIKREGRRPMAMTRSGFCGMQRYGAVIWSGDTHATWEVLAQQIAAGLHIGIAGLPWWNMDMGGFFAGHIEDAWYEELYIRWFQYGMFTPLARNHGTQIKELHLWSEPVRAILKESLALRYRLIPYLYSLSWQVYCSGAPFMRPLAYHFPDDWEALDINDQFLLGENLLVCPVITEWARSREVYLPSGADWYDFYTNERHTGGQHICMDAPRNRIPLLVKAGSILPLGEPMQWHNEKPEAPLELRIYPGADACFCLYQDACDGEGYRQGEFRLINVSWQQGTRTLRIEASGEGFPGMTEKVSLAVWLDDRNIESIELSKQSIKLDLSAYA